MGDITHTEFFLKLGQAFFSCCLKPSVPCLFMEDFARNQSNRVTRDPIERRLFTASCILSRKLAAPPGFKIHLRHSDSVVT